MKSMALAGLVGLILIGVANGQETDAKAEARQAALLKRAPELQQIARECNGGARGCGVAMVTLVTSQGPVKITCGTDTVELFGSEIEVVDLLALLRARSESNESGKGPMAGKVQDLCFVILNTLGSSRAPEAISPIAALLTDEADMIRGFAVIALLALSEDEALRARVAEIEFPAAALKSATDRGIEVPAWVKQAG